MQGLNTLFGNRSHVMVLRTLYRAELPMTGREIERKCGLSNRATMLALETLTEVQAVHKAEAGRAYHFTLNKGHYLIAKVMKTAFEAEELFWDDVSKTIRRHVRPRPTAAVATVGGEAEDDSSNAMTSSS